MKNTISNIILPADTWVNIYLAPAIVAAGISIGDRLAFTNIEGTINLNFSANKPGQGAGFTPLEKGFEISNSLGSLGAWAISRGADGLINVGENVTAEMPDGLFSGTRAITQQTYTEANSKAGVQHEGSVLLTGVAGGAVNNTIFLTGSLPVSLKARIISYSGEGVQGEIFESPTYTGGVDTPYQNASAINPVAGLAKILVTPAVTDPGTLVFAPSYSIGNKSNQGQGSTSSALGGERLLKPNTAYLLRLTSLDSAAQDISSFLSWYEGELDLPL